MVREGLSDALQEARDHSNKPATYATRDQEYQSVLEAKSDGMVPAEVAMVPAEVDSRLTRKAQWVERMAK